MNTDPKPSPSSEPAPEDNVYADVYTVLLAGMVVSTALFALGLLRGMMLHTQFPLSPEWVRDQYHLGQVLRGLLRLDPVALMLAATFLLILTPVIRVMVSIYAFWVDGDRRYVAVTSIVLFSMILTLVLSLLGLR